MPAGTWIAERSGGTGGGGTGGLVIGFVINDGTAGSNVGPMLPAPRSGSLTRCVTVVKASTGAALTFTIKKNGTAIFGTPVTLAGGSGAGTITETTGFTSTVALDDLFTIDITAGAAGWKFTAQLE